MFSERRENHEECGDNRERKYIKPVPGGEVWFCHNCAKGGFLKVGTSTPRETVSNVISTIRTSINISTEQTVRQIMLPLDITTIIPTLGLGWLYKYYITDEEIKKYNICYSEQYQRLILPVYTSDGTLVYWQGRSLKPPYTKDNPKYLNIRQGDVKNVFFKVIKGYPYEDIYPLYRLDCLVIVEDILSAIRVGRTHNSLALLGSYLPPTILNEFREYSTILIYLDHDKWETAIKASIKFNKLTGKCFIVKHHLLDPKALNPKDLEEFLNET